MTKRDLKVKREVEELDLKGVINIELDDGSVIVRVKGKDFERVLSELDKNFSGLSGVSDGVQVGSLWISSQDSDRVEDVL